LKQIKETENRRLSGNKIEDRLLQMGKAREIQLAKLQEQYIEERKKDIYDRPKINSNSLLLVK
jgi:hypothetical protein